MPRTMHATQVANCAPDRDEVETTGEVLGDGTMLEMILAPENREEPRLLAWNGKDASLHKRFNHNDKVFVLPKLNANLLHALHLPTKIMPYGSTRELFNDVLAALMRYTP